MPDTRFGEAFSRRLLECMRAERAARTPEWIIQALGFVELAFARADAREGRCGD